MSKSFLGFGYYFSVLFRALSLDIWDLNYTYSTPKTLERYKAIGAAWPAKVSVVARIGSFFFHMLEAFVRLLRTKFFYPPANAVLLFAITQNQTAALKPLLDKLTSCYLVKDRHKVDEGIQFPVFWAYFLSLFFLPLLAYQFWSKRQKVNIYDICRYRLDGYWLAYGYYIVARLWLHHVKPAAIVFSNDHSMECRAWNLAAREEGITTFYLQHAAVSDEFPPLSFDYALLDGIDSLDIYERIGPSETEVYLVGNLKHDHAYHLINTHTTATSIGLCTNILDPLDSVTEVCLALRSRFPDHELYLRPHPADKRLDEWQKLAETTRMQLSHSRSQDAYEFLQCIDVMIAGNTSMHVEAALLNVYPIFYDFSQNPMFRVYSFLSRNLCEQAETVDELLAYCAALAESKPNIRGRAKPYCATINTAFDGQVTQLVKELIEERRVQNTISHQRWQRVEGHRLKSYRLNEQLEKSFS
jgi:hypothetical protein